MVADSTIRDLEVRTQDRLIPTELDQFFSPLIEVLFFSKGRISTCPVRGILIRYCIPNCSNWPYVTCRFRRFPVQSSSNSPKRRNARVLLGGHSAGRSLSMVPDNNPKPEVEHVNEPRMGIRVELASPPDNEPGTTSKSANPSRATAGRASDCRITLTLLPRSCEINTFQRVLDHRHVPVPHSSQDIQSIVRKE
jgi:hypothetical protein